MFLSALPFSPARAQTAQVIYSDQNPSVCYFEGSSELGQPTCQEFELRQDSVAGALLWGFNDFTEGGPTWLIVTEEQPESINENGISLYRLTTLIGEGQVFSEDSSPLSVQGVCVHSPNYERAGCSVTLQSEDWEGGSTFYYSDGVQ